SHTQADRPCRNACHSLFRTNVTRDDRAGTYDRAVPNLNALQNNGPCTDPHIASDVYRAAKKGLFNFGNNRFSSMIMISNVAEGADKTVSPDRDILRSIKHREAVHVCTATY